MKSRVEIKALAREANALQRAPGILAPLLVALLMFGLGLLVLIPILGILVYAALFVLIFVLAVNLCGLFLTIWRRESASAGDVLTALSGNFGRKLGGMLWMGLWVWLWSLLLIIPGIVKGIAYSMTPYILADSPNVTAGDALKLSMRLTDGHKGELFVMYLSFIGWDILSSLTFGILGVVYVYPYFSTTAAGYYEELKDSALESGIVTREQFGEA